VDNLLKKLFVKVRESDAEYLQMDVRPVLPVLGVVVGIVVGLVVAISGLQPYLGVMLIVAGPLAVSYAPKKTVVLDRKADGLAVYKRGRLAAATGPAEASCKLSEVTAVEVVSSKSDQRKVRTELVLADDKRLAIERPFSVFAAKHQVIAATLRSFLFETPAPAEGATGGAEDTPDETTDETMSEPPAGQPEE
jgi:hypothetical protein